MLLKSIKCMILAVLATGLSASNSYASTRPNVLLIMTDDQGYGDFSIYGNPHLKTPNLDNLAKSSIQFERFHVSSYCAPTRASLLTGRYPERCGVWGVTLNKEAMRPGEVTLAETLRSAGYRTACIGKWHNGEQYPYTPPGQGFDEFLGFCNGHTNNYFDATLIRGSKSEATRGYIADVLTDEAIQFIEGEPNQPFFCYLSYNTPHSPFQVPDKYFDKYHAMGLSVTAAAFYGMCENIDDNVGRLLAASTARQLDEDTIVLFLTDNGGTIVTDIYNAGMRGGKTSSHEGGTRVPLFIRWPARFSQPRTITQIAAHIDLYPTILDLCGVETPSNQPPLDGVSLRPLLDGETGNWPERVIFFHNPISEHNRYPGAVRTQRYRLVRDIEGPAGGSSAKENDASATPWQLYDMQTDPGERHDLASEQPAIVAELSQRYEQWLDNVCEKGFERFAIPVGHAEENPVTLQAHQAYFSGGIHFAAGPGYAHDYLTDWTSQDTQISFDIEVVEAGEYDVVALYGCTSENEGSRIQLTASKSHIETTVAAAEAPFMKLPHRDAAGHKELVLRDWARLPLGRVHLDVGRTRLALQASSIKGQSVMDFKGLELHRLD